MRHRSTNTAPRRTMERVRREARGEVLSAFGVDSSRIGASVFVEGRRPCSCCGVIECTKPIAKPAPAPVQQEGRAGWVKQGDPCSRGWYGCWHRGGACVYVSGIGAGEQPKYCARIYGPDGHRDNDDHVSALANSVPLADAQLWAEQQLATREGEAVRERPLPGDVWEYRQNGGSKHVHHITSLGAEFAYVGSVTSGLRVDGTWMAPESGSWRLLERAGKPVNPPHAREGGADDARAGLAALGFVLVSDRELGSTFHHVSGAWVALAKGDWSARTRWAGARPGDETAVHRHSDYRAAAAYALGKSVGAL